MHESFGFIHRDIKPENVLIAAPTKPMSSKKQTVWDDPNFCDNAVIKLCDLGLSKPIETEGTATCVGTASFMCPEIYLGQSYDFKADVWALGSLAWELLTGIRIMDFFDPSKKAIDEKFISGLLYLPQLDKCSLEMVDFFSACLQFDPSKRASIPEVLKHPYLTMPIEDQRAVP